MAEVIDGFKIDATNRQTNKTILDGGFLLEAGVNQCLGSTEYANRYDPLGNMDISTSDEYLEDGSIIENKFLVTKFDDLDLRNFTVLDGLIINRAWYSFSAVVAMTISKEVDISKLDYYKKVEFTSEIDWHIYDRTKNKLYFVELGELRETNRLYEPIKNTEYLFFNYKLNYTTNGISSYVENGYIYLYTAKPRSRLEITSVEEMDLYNSDVSFVLKELGYI